MHKIMNKFFLPCFYTFCVIGIIIAGFNFINVKEEQKKQLLTIEKNLNIESTNEKVQLLLNDENKDADVIYISSDEDIVRVDENGNLIAVGEGHATVTVKTKDKKYAQSLIVNVGQDAIDEYEKEQSKKPQKTPKPSVPTPDEQKEPIVEDGSIRVTGIALDQTAVSLSLNSSIQSAQISATVYPLDATNKNIIWSTSDTNIATVSNGVITAHNPGRAIITATTADGSKSETVVVKVTKRIAIVVGESQVTKMANEKLEYSSKSYQYKVSDGTLVYIHKSGTGIEYQTSEGYKKLKEELNKYKSVKRYTHFYIFFPLSGNSIKEFKCEDISENNSQIKAYASSYNNIIKTFKEDIYNVNGYIVSVHPTKVSQATSNKIVSNKNKNACKKGYQSNWKYYQFNLALKTVIDLKYTDNLDYISLFTKIMEVSNKQENFKFKTTYNTTDGNLWDETTTQKYVDMMLSYTDDL